MGRWRVDGWVNGWIQGPINIPRIRDSRVRRNFMDVQEKEKEETGLVWMFIMSPKSLPSRSLHPD